MWNLPPPSGFQGLREDLPLQVYVRHLPHWRQEGATYFVTFRLHDSLPQEKLQQLEVLRREWELRNPALQRNVHLPQLSFKTNPRVEHGLDHCMESRHLRNSA